MIIFIIIWIFMWFFFFGMSNLYMVKRKLTLVTAPLEITIWFLLGTLVMFKIWEPLTPYVLADYISNKYLLVLYLVGALFLFWIVNKTLKPEILKKLNRKSLMCLATPGLRFAIPKFMDVIFQQALVGILIYKLVSEGYPNIQVIFISYLMFALVHSPVFLFFTKENRKSGLIILAIPLLIGWVFPVLALKIGYHAPFMGHIAFYVAYLLAISYIEDFRKQIA